MSASGQKSHIRNWNCSWMQHTRTVKVIASCSDDAPNQKTDHDGTAFHDRRAESLT